MNNPGALMSYLQFLMINKKFESGEIANFLNNTSIGDFKEIREKHLDFSNAFTEACMNLRSKMKNIIKSEYEVSYFYNKINVHRSTYNSWKKMGFFKNEKGTKFKRKIPLSDIEELLEKMPKYKVLWNKQD